MTLVARLRWRALLAALLAGSVECGPGAEPADTPKTFYNLTGGLLKKGYSKEDVAKIMGGNWLRVMKEVWG